MMLHMFDRHHLTKNRPREYLWKREEKTMDDVIAFSGPGEARGLKLRNGVFRERSDSLKIPIATKKTGRVVANNFF